MNTFFTPLTFGEVGTVLTNTHIKIIAKKKKNKKKPFQFHFLVDKKISRFLQEGFVVRFVSPSFAISLVKSLFCTEKIGKLEMNVTDEVFNFSKQKVKKFENVKSNTFLINYWFSLTSKLNC